MSTLYLIRHGRTPANDRHLYCGSTDIGLSEEGKAELKTLRYDISPELCITSGMKRTEETFSILFGDLPHTQDERFREIDFGVFEMHSYEELKDRKDYQAWLTGDNEKNVPPGGESGYAMTARVLNALKEILDRDRDTLILTHGGVIAAMMENLFPEAGKSRYAWQPKPGHGYAIGPEGLREIP